MPTLYWYPRGHKSVPTLALGKPCAIAASSFSAEKSEQPKREGLDKTARENFSMRAYFDDEELII